MKKPHWGFAEVPARPKPPPRLEGNKPRPAGGQSSVSLMTQDIGLPVEPVHRRGPGLNAQVLWRREQLVYIRALHAAGNTKRSIGELYGVHPRAIRHALKIPIDDGDQTGLNV